MVSLLTSCLLVLAPATAPPNYCIVVSESTRDAPQWSRVVAALRDKHDGQVIEYDSSVESARRTLRQTFPRYTCFVVKPSEATRGFVSTVHQLTRELDNDPYADTFWGILTGYNAASALRTARHEKPLTIRKVGAATEIAMEMVEEGVWYCELEQHHMVKKERGEPAREQTAPGDTTAALVQVLNKYQPDLFVTSGHATERDWQIGYRYPNGHFESRAGRLVGVDTEGERYPIASPNPKAYLAVGNCLMGHIDGPDAMALAWMHSAGVHQMVGYTVPTWFGYGGWGMLDYFLEQPGRYTLAEAFQANHHALIHALENGIGSKRGLRYDRDVVAFYGDPAWPVRMADRPKAYEQELSEFEGGFTFTVRGKRGEESFSPLNTNGSQRGWRPIVQFLPYRVENIEILEGSELEPVITDDFILMPNPRRYDASRKYQIRFRAEGVEGQSG